MTGLYVIFYIRLCVFLWYHKEVSDKYDVVTPMWAVIQVWRNRKVSFELDYEEAQNNMHKTSVASYESQ